MVKMVTGQKHIINAAQFTDAMKEVDIFQVRGLPSGCQRLFRFWPPS